MSDSDSDQDDFTTRPSRWGWLLPNVAGRLAAVAVGLTVLYVLSIGPAIALTRGGNSVIQQDDLRTFYQPVIWMHDNTILEQPLEWYVEMWERR